MIELYNWKETTKPHILHFQGKAKLHYSVLFKNASKISFIFDRFLDGYEIKRSMLKTYVQCRAFLKRYQKKLSPDQKKLLESYLMVGRGNKIQRVLRLFAGGFLKHGFFRKLGQVIYI